MRQRLGIPELAIEVIPNGIDLDGYGPPANDAGPPVIGYLARMIREKGIEVMVDAFIHLRNVLDCLDVRLHLAGAATAGDQPLLDSLQRKVADAGLSEAVRWSPNLSRSAKADMLRSLTLFSVPAIYQEAFGLYVVEAMASGVPVVQPDAAAFREIVGPAGAGLLVPPGDAVALAEAWRGLLQDAPRRRELGARGRRAAEESYSATTMTARFLALARKLVCAGA
jgi:glycosyltransferase involved in cell wall biosynthesis